MCIGLHADNVDEVDRKLGDLSIEPFLSSRVKRTFTPKKSDLVDEVQRRFQISEYSKERKPHATNWSNDALIKWLNDHPIIDEADVSFLRAEEKKFYDILVEANTDTSENSQVSLGGVVWDHLADMRLIHCLILDEVKEAYLARHEIMSRSELDAHSQSNSTNTIEEVITQCYNNRNFKPVSIKLPSLHEDFLQEHDLSLENMLCEVTHDQVKRWLQDRRAKLVNMINKWERSGNGAGNRSEGDKNYEIFNDDFRFQDDDDRANFLSNNRPTMLYY